MFKGMHFMLNFKVFMSKILQEELTRRGGLGFCEKYGKCSAGSLKWMKKIKMLMLLCHQNQSTSTKRDGLDTISLLEAGEEIQEILRRGQTAKGM